MRRRSTTTASTASSKPWSVLRPRPGVVVEVIRRDRLLKLCAKLFCARLTWSAYVLRFSAALSLPHAVAPKTVATATRTGITLLTAVRLPARSVRAIQLWRGSDCARLPPHRWRTCALPDRRPLPEPLRLAPQREEPDPARAGAADGLLARPQVLRRVEEGPGRAGRLGAAVGAADLGRDRPPALRGGAREHPGAGAGPLVAERADRRGDLRPRGRGGVARERREARPRRDRAGRRGGGVLVVARRQHEVGGAGERGPVVRGGAVDVGRGAPDRVDREVAVLGVQRRGELRDERAV